jgi:hypothetical protein
MATQTTTEDKVKAQEKENVERQAAVTGAEAVAAAVTKVAQDAVVKARDQGPSAVLGDFTVSGSPGGKFELRAKTGPIFSSSGTVFVNGKPQVTFEWGATYIRGKFDSDVTAGSTGYAEVVVQVSNDVRKVGYLKVS